MELTEQLINERTQFLYNRDYSEKTKNNYKSDLKLFFNRLKIQNWKTIGDTISENEITLKRIEDRTSYLKTIPTPKTSIYYTKQPTISPATIQWKKVAIKSFLKFLNLIYEVWLDYQKVETKRYKSDYIECITDTERNLFFNFIPTYEKYKINALRMQLLCNIAYTSWLRLSEILNLKVEDVKKRGCRIIWKWHKRRWAFFTNSSLELLNEYLIERGKPLPRTGKRQKDSDFIFISHNNWYFWGKPLKKNVICDKMKKYSEEIDLWKRITVHTLRHSYATRLLENWMNMREIQELLGHSDIETTVWYCHVLASNLQEKVNKIFS